MAKPPPLNLDRALDWQKVLRELGQPHPAGLLPCVATCPLCAGALDIHQDNTEGSPWHRCRGCNSAGSLLTLAERKWQCDTRVALDRLAQAGAGPTVDANELAAYEEAYIDVQRDADDYWRRCSELAMSHPILRHTRLDWWGTDALAPAVWESCGGRQLIGLSSREDFELFLKNNRGDLQGLFTDLPRRNRKRGDEEPELVLLPLHRVPGRLTGFIYASFDGQGELKVRGVREWRVAGKRREPRDTGWTFEGTSQQTTEQGTVVCFDPVLVARNQASALRAGFRAMPLTAVWPTSLPCADLANHRLVYWAETWTDDLFRHAQANNAHVARPSPAFDDGSYHRRYWLTPQVWIDTRRRRSRTWDASLEEYLGQKEAIDAATCLNRFHWTAAQRDAFVDGCNSRLRTTLRSLLDPGQTRGTVVVDGKTFRENADGIVDEDGERVADFHLRVDRIVYFRDASRRYEGRVVGGGHDIAFVADGEAFEKSPWEWIRRHLLERELAVLAFDDRHAKLALSLAAAVQKPTTVFGVDSCGWDPKRAGFVLGEYLVPSGLEPTRHGLPLRIPSAAWLEPRQLTSAEYVDLGKPGERILASAIGAAVFDAIVAPAFDLPARAVLLTGDARRSLVEAVRLVGLTPRPFGRLPDKPANTTWPELLDVVHLPRRELLRWDRRLHVNRWFAHDLRTVEALQLHGGYHRLHYDRPFDPVLAAQRAQRLVGGCLRDLMNRRLRPWQSGLEATHFGVANFQSWLHVIHDDHWEHVHLRHHLSTDLPKRCGEAFLRLVTRMYRVGLRGRKAGREGEGLGLEPMDVRLVSGQRQAAWLDQAAVLNALAASGIDLHAEDASAALARAGWLLGQTEDGGDLGWLVPLDAWERQCRWVKEHRGARNIAITDKLNQLRYGRASAEADDKIA
jgi:hypothetical protein